MSDPQSRGRKLVVVLIVAMVTFSAACSPQMDRDRDDIPDIIDRDIDDLGYVDPLLPPGPALQGGDEVEPVLSEEPEPDQPALPASVKVIPVVVDQNCHNSFDEYNEISGRTPSFQVLLEFVAADPDAILGSVVTLEVTRPDGETAIFAATIVKDTSSGKPIIYITNPDPDLPAGSYSWTILSVQYDETMIDVESGGEGIFSVVQMKLDGCSL